MRSAVTSSPGGLVPTTAADKPVVPISATVRRRSGEEIMSWKDVVYDAPLWLEFHKNGHETEFLASCRLGVADEVTRLSRKIGKIGAHRAPLQPSLVTSAATWLIRRSGLPSTGRRCSNSPALPRSRACPRRER